MPQVVPPLWATDRLETERQVSIDAFRHERIGESAGQYRAFFQPARKAIEAILEMSADLLRVRESAVDILTDSDLVDAARYLASPPISKDDLETVAGTSLAPTLLQSDPERAARLMDTILYGLDRERFPWVREDREATEAERHTAVVSTAAMLAFRQLETRRRNEGKRSQEAKVKDFLREQCSFSEVPARKIVNMSLAPGPGEFCGETDVGSRKADISVRLWDGRIMPIECKVSNSATNSYKRINNDAAAKAVTWRAEFGTQNAVPTAVLSGVFALANLRYAQDNGLYLIWAHDLGPLETFIEQTRPPTRRR
jgi:XamI restriction endonuclease